MKKGFTLIELLAVLVILAILALITTPIVTDIINNTRDESELASAELYIDTVNKTIVSYNMSNKLKDAICEVEENGNLNCNDGTILEVGVQNTSAKSGTVTIENRRVSKVENLKVGRKYYSTDINGELVGSETAKYKIVSNLTNLTSSGETLAETGKETTVTLSPSSRYVLPESITVTGATYTYDNTTGVLTITNPTKDVTITAIGPERILVKGDIITMDLDPNTESETYRVLKVNGTQVEVMSMFDLTTSQKYNEDTTSNTATFGDKTGQKYAGSLLDTYLNTTWYNTLNSTAKAAIIAQNKTQDMWYGGADGDPDYNGTYFLESKPNYTISKHSGTVSIGNRNVYVLSVQDVIDYLEVTSSMTNDNSTLNPSNIWQMFWNTTSKPSGNVRTIWLSSAYVAKSSHAFGVSPSGGGLGLASATLAYTVRAAFVIDLSKVNWNWS